MPLNQKKKKTSTIKGLCWISCAAKLLQEKDGKTREWIDSLADCTGQAEIIMGISIIVGVKAALLLWVFMALRWRVNPVLLFPLIHASLVGFLAAITAHPALNLPLLFGKNTDGSFPWWSILLFYPYLIPLRIYVRLRRFRTVEPLYSEVAPQLYVGGWPSSLEDLPPGSPAIVDCTCELPRSSSPKNSAYLCIPTWDSRAPRPEDIELAVRWAATKRAQNRPIFVHCAFGHGRSVAVMCALLVTLGLAKDWKEAEKIIKECRPFIRMNVLQRQSLEEWSRLRVSPNGNVQTSNGSLFALSGIANEDHLRNRKQRNLISE